MDTFSMQPTLLEWVRVDFCILGYPQMQLGKKKINDERVFTL